MRRRADSAPAPSPRGAARAGALVVLAVAALAGPAAGAAAATGGGPSTAGAALTGGASPTSAPPASEGLARNPWRLGTRTLRRGARGDDVRALQWLLTRLGYRAAITGTFDRTTASALRRFEGDGGLRVDAVVDARTRRALLSSKGNPMSLAASSGWAFPLTPRRRVLPSSTWSTDQGVDIPTLNGACDRKVTVLAVESGTVVQIGISGFGRWAPVVRLDQGPFAGRYVYYGHTKPNLVRKGDHVSRGQPIARIGCGSVGISSAPHLEIGISAPGGPPCCPGFGETAPVVSKIMRALWADEARRARARRR